MDPSRFARELAAEEEQAGSERRKGLGLVKGKKYITPATCGFSIKLLAHRAFSVSEIFRGSLWAGLCTMIFLEKI